MTKPDREAIIREMRGLYQSIYDWHTQRGKQTYLEKHGRSVEDRGEWFQKYLELLHAMPVPSEATPEQMNEVARAVTSGCMEWSCGTTIGQSSLFQIAARIREMWDTFSKSETQQNEEPDRDRLRTMRNRSRHPQIVRIKLPPGTEVNAEYESLAELAYSDVHTDVHNLGGGVALADTNLQHSDTVQHTQDGDGLLVTFRNASALHFQEVNGPESLVSYAQSGTLSILSVTIGVRR